jgi:cytochrome c oxidase assembly factor CtaG
MQLQTRFALFIASLSVACAAHAHGFGGYDKLVTYILLALLAAVVVIVIFIVMTWRSIRRLRRTKERSEMLRAALLISAVVTGVSLLVRMLMEFVS